MLGVTSKTSLRLEKAKVFTRQETNAFEGLKLNSFHVAESAITFSTGPDSKTFSTLLTTQSFPGHMLFSLCVCVCVLPHFKM